MPDNLPPYSDFLPGSSSPSGEFDTSSPLPFDSPADTLDFWDATSLSLETDPSAGSPDMSVGTILNTVSSGTPRESLCGTSTPDIQPYSKRDGDICSPKQQPPIEPPPLLELPDLEKLEQILGPNRVDTPEELDFQIFPIPGYTRVGDQENLCPMPKRRLCCLGPPSGNVGNIWSVINHCRGMSKTSPFFFLS